MRVTTIVMLWSVSCMAVELALFYVWKRRAVLGAGLGFLALAVACCWGILAVMWLAGALDASLLSLASAVGMLALVTGVGLAGGWLMTQGMKS